MRYDSFLVRCWHHCDKRRIEVAHMHSGGWMRGVTFTAAAHWIGKQCDGVTERESAIVPDVAGGEVQTEETARESATTSDETCSRAALRRAREYVDE